MKKIIVIIILANLFCFKLLARDYIIIQSTTSTENSGLLKKIEESFENKFDIDVRFVSVGTGQAIKNAMNGDGDLLFIHSKEDELMFIKKDYGVERFDIMYNDFIIIGPNYDPAGIKKTKNINDAMRKIALSKSYFLSRDDKSGTHKKELYLWKLAKVDIKKKSKWYLKNGLGMGITLNMASELNAYTLTDRATWLTFNNKRKLEILFQNDKSLHNPYGIIPINPNKFFHTEYDKSMIFVNWILSNEGKSVINDYKLNGQQLFFTY